eukprot:scaffold1658_cov248-Chaetoceros_neogracile.AAC.5
MRLSRLDNLAHVLIWSSANVRDAGDASSIDLIELPRVNLSLKAKQIETINEKSEHRLYSNNGHNGRYISTSTGSREIDDKLVGLISHFIVLQNSYNDLFVLMPGCALPRRLNTDGTALSVQVILDRNKEWIDNMGEVRCYLYPVHNSQVTVWLGDESVKCPWNVQDEMKEYVLKHAYVSSACRLSKDEETLLLQLCTTNMRSELYKELVNRKAFVEAVATLDHIPPDQTVMVTLGLSKKPAIKNFDGVTDTSILDNHKRSCLHPRCSVQLIQDREMLALHTWSVWLPLIYDPLLGTVPMTSLTMGEDSY